MRTGKPIIYTSADSVLQIAAHEETFGLERLYTLCEKAFDLVRPYHIARVIARPLWERHRRTLPGPAIVMTMPWLHRKRPWWTGPMKRPVEPMPLARLQISLLIVELQNNTRPLVYPLF